MFSRAARVRFLRAGSRTFWSSSGTPPPPPPPPNPLFPSIPPDLSPLVLAAVLASSPSTDRDAESNPPPWIVTDLSSVGKGRGAIASRELKRGELIIAERPLCVWPQDLTPSQALQLFEGMSDRQKKVFMDLAVTEGEGLPVLDEIRGRRATNGFALQLPGSNGTVAMVFPQIARVNHSCTPNACQTMNYETLRMELYPLATIPPKTEITIEYLPGLILLPHSDRQAALREAFGFQSCLCELCSSPPQVRAESDKRRFEIRMIGRWLSDGSRGREETLNAMERVRLLLEREGYQGLPEFEEQSVSHAFAVYMTLWRRGELLNRAT